MNDERWVKEGYIDIGKETGERERERGKVREG